MRSEERRGLSWPRRIGIGTLVAVAALIGLGLIYQAVATEIDRRNLPPPGQMVEVGDSSLHLRVMGEDTGGPTVVLEAGSMFGSSQWGLIQPEIAEFARVVSYDRPGIGWSDPSDRPRDAAEVAAQLQTALQEAGIDGPYVLVGHSLGGLYARVHADRYPGEVAGVVLVDATGPELTDRLTSEELAEAQAFAGVARVFQVIAPLGVVRALDPVEGLTGDLPEEDAAAIRAHSATSTYWEAAHQEQLESQFPDSESYAQAREASDLADIPVIAIARTEPVDSFTQATQEAAEEMASLSTNGRVRIVEGADHISFATDAQHAQAVVDSTRELVEAARGG